MPSGPSVIEPSMTCLPAPRLLKSIEPLHSPWYGLLESASHQIQKPNDPSESLNAPVLLKTTCSEAFEAWAGAENLEERVKGIDRIDPVVLAELRKR
jgi:hypothetical protein